MSKKVLVGGGWTFLNLVSTPGLVLSRSRPNFVSLLTRSAKAKFGKVGEKVQAKEQVGQGQGQELDNICFSLP